jgi:hypothetical protein
MTNVEDVRGTEQLSSLRNVALSFCHRVLSLASLRGKLPLVTHLSLVSVWIYDVDLAVVGTLAALESLVLRDIPHITTLAPLSARGCGGGNSPLPHLTRLETARCLSLVSVGGVELLAQLRSLSLALCSAIPVAASAQLLQHKCRPAGAADVAELDISGVTVALRPATADLAVHRATVLAGVRSLHWSGGRWAADGRLLATQMLNATLCPRLTALHIESLRPMNNEIAASIVEALPGLVTLKLGGRDEVRTLEFVKSAGPLLVELTVVFATPLHLDGAALDALLPREWSRLELRVHSPEAWAAAGVSARELMLHS